MGWQNGAGFDGLVGRVRKTCGCGWMGVVNGWVVILVNNMCVDGLVLWVGWEMRAGMDGGARARPREVDGGVIRGLSGHPGGAVLLDRRHQQNLRAGNIHNPFHSIVLITSLKVNIIRLIGALGHRNIGDPPHNYSFQTPPPTDPPQVFACKLGAPAKEYPGAPR